MWPVMDRWTRSVLVACSCVASVSCIGIEPESEDADETAVEWITCGGRVPDRTASTLSALPFQTLDRATVPAAASSIAWTWPTTTNEMANNFGAGRSYNEGHEGADLGGRRGDVIRAAAAGRVVYALSSCPDNDMRRDITCGNGWGNHVVIDHGRGVFTRYAHLQWLTVAVDATVTAGQTLGMLGHSGLSDGPHLHFELGTRARPFAACAAPQNFDRVYNPARLRYGAVPTTQAPPRWCRVSADEANVRATPNGTILRTLTHGASVTVVRAQGTWYSVRFRIDGRDWGGDASPAWVSAQMLSCTQ
jgi:hypothetical protein